MLPLTVSLVELTKLGPPYAVPVRVSVKAWVRLRLTPGKLARNGEGALVVWKLVYEPDNWIWSCSVN